MIIFRNSEIGHCERNLTLSTVGASGKVPKWLENSAEEGKWHEKRVKDQMRKAGYDVHEVEICPVCLERFGEERNGIHVEFENSDVPTDEQYKLIGHIDGSAMHPEFTKGQFYGLEVKSMSQYEYDRWIRESWKGFKSYAWQISSYMHITNVPFIYYVKNRNIGSKISFVIEQPIIQWNEIDLKLRNLAKWINTNGTTPYPAEFDGDSIECRRCKYAHLCVPEPKMLEPVQEQVLNKAVEDWHTGKKMEKDAEILITSAEDVFIQHCKVTTVNKWRYKNVSISYNPEPNPRTSYPKENLLKVLTEQQLQEIANVTPAKPSIRVTKLDKEV